MQKSHSGSEAPIAPKPQSGGPGAYNATVVRSDKRRRHLWTALRNNDLIDKVRSMAPIVNWGTVRVALERKWDADVCSSHFHKIRGDYPHIDITEEIGGISRR